METKIVTAITTEPLSLAEVKLHLRLQSETYAGDTVTYQSIVPENHVVAAAYSLEGSSADVLNKTTLVNLNAGTCAGTVTAKIQESDDDTLWQDYSTFTPVTTANDNAIQELAYTGTKQYVRVVATVASATSNFSADIVTKSGDVTEDNLLNMLITSAREYCENYTRRAFATQTLEGYLDCFPSDVIEIPNPPLQSVTSIKYTDSDSTETTLTEDTDYIVDTDSNIGRIVLPYGESYPSFTPYTVNPIKIRYITGYYASNLIPKALKQAMLLLIGHWYLNREAVAPNMTTEIKFAVQALLSMYRVGWL